MSSSVGGAVYQPTTVTCENSTAWQTRPISYLTTGTGGSSGRKRCPSCWPIDRSFLPIICITSCLGCFTLGMVMLIHGIVGYSNTDTDSEDLFLVVTIFGGFFFGASILLFVAFVRLRQIACWRSTKDHMNAASVTQPLTVNPSTDMLVMAQYAPVVTEVAYQPQGHDDSEQSKLMPVEHKELSNEDTDRMVETDPRIVLRPLNAPSPVHEEA